MTWWEGELEWLGAWGQTEGGRAHAIHMLIAHEKALRQQATDIDRTGEGEQS